MVLRRITENMESRKGKKIKIRKGCLEKERGSVKDGVKLVPLIQKGQMARMFISVECRMVHAQFFEA